MVKKTKNTKNYLTLKIKFKDKVYLDGKKCEGVYHPCNDSIDVQKSNPLSETIDTLYHEFTHFIVEKFKLNLQKISNRREEKLCEDIAAKASNYLMTEFAISSKYSKTIKRR